MISEEKIIISIVEMIKESGVSVREISSRLGKKYSTLQRELNPKDKLVRLSVSTAFNIMSFVWENRNIPPLPLQFMCESIGFEPIPMGDGK